MALSLAGEIVRINKAQHYNQEGGRLCLKTEDNAKARSARKSGNGQIGGQKNRKTA